jgi:ABC-type amino acid transport substrate-binding protein
VVGAASTAASIQDVAAGPICAVADDASMDWLLGGYGAAASTAATSSVITRPSDADCLNAIDTGDAVAFLTARLSDAELQVLADIRVIGGPDAEPRPVLVRRRTGSEADPADLLAALDGALAAMRADGTLTRLSQSRFGGADLTRP